MKPPQVNVSLLCYSTAIKAFSFKLWCFCLLQSTDPSQKNTQLILKFLPFMIGYFSLSVPSGLSIYWYVHLLWVLHYMYSFLPQWVFAVDQNLYCVLTPCRFTNNVLSTAQQIWLRKLGGAKPVVNEGASGIITAGRAKRSGAQSGQGGERWLQTSSAIYFNYICSGCNIENILSRFKQLKEEENRRKATKALGAGDSNGSASTSDDEEPDEDTTDEVLVFLDSSVLLEHCDVDNQC
jgi:YidC/Oxa1 family membrane protein insertase